MRIVPLLVIAAFSLPAAAQNITPGEWEFTTTTTSPAFPKPQVATRTQCVTPEEAKDPTAFSGTGAMQGCQVNPGAKTSSSYEWGVSCPAHGLTGTGKVQFSGSTIQGVVDVVVDAQGKLLQISSRTAGRLLGPCKTKQ